MATQKIVPVTASKPFWQSKTLIGIVVGLVGVLLNHFNVPADLPSNADTNAILVYGQEIAAAKGSFVGILSIVLSAVGPLLAVYGRIKSDTVLTLTAKK